MQRKIANLEVWIDDQSPIPTRMARSRDDGSKYCLIINPGDECQLSKLGIASKAIGKWTSILAHEVGHFIAWVFNSPLQSDAALTLAPILAEKYAWDMAYYVNPNINNDVKQKALATYMPENSEDAK